MKIKRYFAADMRQAIRMVRDEQGPDAVILSNRKVDGGIEIIAALDYDEALVNQALGQASTTAAPNTAATEAAPRTAAAPTSSNKPAPAPARAAVAELHKPVAPAKTETSVADRKAGIYWAQDPALVEMRREIHELRGLLENQLAHLAWGDMQRRQPIKTELLKRLTDLGLTPALCNLLTEQVGPVEDEEQGWRRALGLLAHHVTVTDDDILSSGGIVALVGSTGVGKTTTVAKLAARFALRHGQRSVALITTDCYRIGAHEQLFTYGRILGVPVQVASSHEELHTTLSSLADKRLVLIDTAGMSQRDLRLAEQFSTLRDCGFPIQSYLVMNATTQAGVLQETLRAFGSVALSGCIMTKLDEAASLGGVLSVIAQHTLPLAYIGDGQRVPEDLHPARAHNLVNRAVSLMQQAGQDSNDETLAERFGGMAANVHV
ncbi:MAG: flagellar biosynthesis protein FlhF [Gammaproteobacteria bacterium]|nr:flagellar biosynthesis protein FlhF [Gammaproteobacteria bacterium]